MIFIATLPAMRGVITVGTFGSFLAAVLLVMAPLKHLTDINASLQEGDAPRQSILSCWTSRARPRVAHCKYSARAAPSSSAT